MRRTARLTLLLAVLLSAGAAVVARAGTYACGAGGVVEEAGGPWLALEPVFSAGENKVTLLAAPAFSPDLIYASNGTQVVRSTDGGCSWAQLLDATTVTGAIPLPGPATVTSLSAPSSANNSSYLYVGFRADVRGVTQPVVHASADRGQTWMTTAGSGLPTLGSVRVVTGSPPRPQTAYALVDTEVAGQVGASHVYATSDAGATWTQRTEAATPFAGSQLLAGPTQPNQVYGLSAGSVVLSEDGGRTFAAVGPTGVSDLGSIDAEVGGGGVRLIAGRADAAQLVRSDDTGQTWDTFTSPVKAVVVAQAPLQEVVAVNDGQNVVLAVPGGAGRPVTPDWQAPSVMQVSAPTAAGFAVTGVARGAVLRATFSVGALEPVLPKGLRPISLLPYSAPYQFPALLVPTGLEVALNAGETRRVPYTLILPRTPTPLDVMFLIDTTGSMGGVIDGLRQDLAEIVNVLVTSGLDARVGLGDFKDYPSPYGGGSQGDYPYKLQRRIGLADEDMRAAIERLQASGGGDGPESALTALIQSTTGAGEMLGDLDLVEAGQQAGYRAGTTRLAVLSTDNPFHRGGEAWAGPEGEQSDYPGPTMEQTAAAMRRADVHQVGLSASFGAHSDLAQMATATRTLAPPGGVDCDGDGVPDLAEGDPLVCDIGDLASAAPVSVGIGNPVAPPTSSISLADAVIGLAEALPDYQAVSLALGPNPSVARLVSQALHPRVNLKADNELPFLLELTCPRNRQATTYPLRLGARAGARTVAAGGLELTCRSTLAPVIPLNPAEPLRAVPVAAAAPAQPVPQTNPNANPNPNPNPNPQLGITHEEQEQHQVALASNDSWSEEHEQLAMSARDPVDPYVLLAAAALMSAGVGGVGLRMRRRTRLRVARVR